MNQHGVYVENVHELPVNVFEWHVISDTSQCIVRLRKLDNQELRAQRAVRLGRGSGRGRMPASQSCVTDIIIKNGLVCAGQPPAHATRSKVVPAFCTSCNRSLSIICLLLFLVVSFELNKLHKSSTFTFVEFMKIYI